MHVASIALAVLWFSNAAVITIDNWNTYPEDKSARSYQLQMVFWGTLQMIGAVALAAMNLMSVAN